MVKRCDYFRPTGPLHTRVRLLCHRIITVLLYYYSFALLPLNVSVMQMPHDEDDGRRGPAKPGGDVVAGDDVWLFVGREGEDGDPGGEDVAEGVHLIAARN